MCASERFSSLRRNHAAPLLTFLAHICDVRPVRHPTYSLPMYWPWYKRSVGREQNSGRKGGPSFHIAYTVSCQWCLLLVSTWGDVVLGQLGQMWCMWWLGRRASCLSTTDLEGEKAFILSSIGGVTFVCTRGFYLTECVGVCVCFTHWAQWRSYCVSEVMKLPATNVSVFRTVRYVGHWLRSQWNTLPYVTNTYAGLWTAFFTACS